MSLSYQPLDTVLVRDPITYIEKPPVYIILKGGTYITYKKFTTTNITNSNITFICPPPAGNVFVDTKIFFVLPVRLLINATGTSTDNILQSNCDAPRAFPISGSLEVMEASINGESQSVYISDIIHALRHYNFNNTMLQRDYSLTPNYPDCSQEYINLVASVRNPLGYYGNTSYGEPMPRGGFPFTIVYNSPTLAVVDMVLCEPLFALSPFNWGAGNSKGFYNVSAMEFTFSFLPTGNRFWSHFFNPYLNQNIISSVQVFFNNFSSAYNNKAFSYIENTPVLLFKYITPESTQILSPNMTLSYPYYNVQRYLSSPVNFTMFPLSGSTNEIIGNNIQLNSIPKMMYIYARRQNSEYYAGGNKTSGIRSGTDLTDTFLALNSISITFANQTGLLASADRRQLYNISVKNGCTLSWTEWSGNPVNFPEPANNTLNTGFGTIGSVLAIEFATDLGLPADYAPGLSGNFQLQVSASFTFTNNTVNNVDKTSMNAVMYIVVVNEGIFTIPSLNAASRQLGVITKADILNAKTKEGINYDSLLDSAYGSGNFLDNIKNFGRKLHDVVKKSHALSELAGLAPVIGGPAKTILSNLGYGEGGDIYDPSYAHGGYGTEEGAEKAVLTKLRRGEIHNAPSLGITGGREMSHSSLLHRARRI